MEAKYNIEQNDILNIDLSEQYLVSDCYPPANCGGRAPDPQARMHTLDYIKNNGITDEACFPYIASNWPCNRCSDWSTRLWKINSYGRVGINIDDIKRALLCHGPLIVCGCGHCVVLVGWNDAINSWIIKNSWGIGWENGGYGMRAYGHCWIGDVYHVEGVGRD